MTRVLVVVFFALLSQSVFSQETLTLTRAIELGLQNNFDIQITKQDIEIAANNNNWGQAGRYPTINLILNQNNNVVQRKPANPFAVAGKNINDNIIGQVDIQFTLFRGFAINVTKNQLARLEEISQGNSTFVMETTLQNIILAYYQALLDKENLNVLRINRSFSKERYEFVRLRKSLGGAITFDVLQEQNNYLTDSANVLQQEIRYTNTLRSLNLLLSDSINHSYILTDSLQFTDQSYVYDDLRSRMERSNTNLHNQFVNQEILRNNTRLQQSALYPSLVLNAGGNGSIDQLNADFRQSTGPLQENTVGYVNRDPAQPVYNSTNSSVFSNQTLVGNSYGAYANLSLRWTLFNGGQIRRSVENAKINEKIGLLSIDQLKLSLEYDLLTTFDLYNLRRQLVAITIEKMKAAELNLELANERYKNGALSAIDLRIVQENYRNAALEKYLALYSVLSAQANLIRLTGGMLERVID
ncbi:MAG TPA: TolC family protein [Chryseolinea sp.]|nr:TolC family protein [Chryseolinea sp.]HPH46111.1 TolC family protein [Chryseolinea sp.]HPM28891.1 TolC family protein [Chryseolinea sp.]